MRWSAAWLGMEAQQSSAEVTVFVAIEVAGASDVAGAARLVVPLLEHARAGHAWIDSWRFGQREAAAVDGNDRDPLVLVMPSTRAGAVWVVVDFDLYDADPADRGAHPLERRLLVALADSAELVDVDDAARVDSMHLAAYGSLNSDGFGVTLDHSAAVETVRPPRPAEWQTLTRPSVMRPTATLTSDTSWAPSL